MKLKKNQQLANEPHKPIIRKFKKIKVCSSFKDNIWGIDLAIDLFSKYAFVVPLKDKKGSTIVDAFQSNLNNSKRESNKIWVDQGSEFYSNHFKKWLKDNDTYSAHNEGKSAVAERFIRTLKSKIYKHMKAISKNVYFDVLNDIVDKYNNTYHSFAEYNEESNEKKS